MPFPIPRSGNEKEAAGGQLCSVSENKGLALSSLLSLAYILKLFLLIPGSASFIYYPSPFVLFNSTFLWETLEGFLCQASVIYGVAENVDGSP